MALWRYPNVGHCVAVHGGWSIGVPKDIMSFQLEETKCMHFFGEYESI